MATGVIHGEWSFITYIRSGGISRRSTQGLSLKLLFQTYLSQEKASDMTAMFPSRIPSTEQSPSMALQWSLEAQQWCHTYYIVAELMDALKSLAGNSSFSPNRVTWQFSRKAVYRIVSNEFQNRMTTWRADANWKQCSTGKNSRATM